MKQHPTIESERRLLSEADAAHYLGISYWTIRNLRFLGELPSVKIKRRILLDKLDLDAYIARAKKGERG